MNNLYGAGSDYTVYSSYDGDISYDPMTNWNIYFDLITWWIQNFHFQSGRMRFSFRNTYVYNGVTENIRSASTYVPAHWETLLQIFSTRGLKIVPGLMQNYNSYGYQGSQDLRNDWIAFTDYWKDRDNGRMSAFQLSQEPTGVTNNGMGAGDLRDWNIDMFTDGVPDRYKLAKFYVQLTRELHQHDPNRVIIYPFLGLSYDYPNELIADFNRIKTETGIDILNEPNTVFDMIHPYLFEKAGWGYVVETEDEARGVADGYEVQFQQWKTALGGDTNKMYCGETFMFLDKSYETDYNYPKVECQRAFWDELLKLFIKYDTAFDMLGIISQQPGNIISANCCTVPGVEGWAPYNPESATAEACRIATNDNPNRLYEPFSLWSIGTEHSNALRANGFGEPLPPQIMFAGKTWTARKGTWGVT